jgi:ABC-type phosphate transport system substrate-binding protein
MKNRSHSLIIAALFALIGATAAHADYKVVVHTSNSVDSVSKDKLADLFLKKVTRWDNGRSVTPVDQSEKNAVRDQFSKGALRKEVSWIESYWQKMIFSGRATPPAKLTSDSEVLDFIRSNPDAIGYVSHGASLPAGVKAVSVKE